MNASSPLVVASRTVFDGALLRAAIDAGAAHVAERVVDLELDTDGIAVVTTRGTYRAAFIVGADGANSLLRRRVAVPFRRDQLSIATGFFARGATSDEILIELVDDPPGYLWSFPRPDHLAVGICASAAAGLTAADLRARARGWIAATGIADEAALDAYSWPIPSLSPADFARLTLAGPRWWLVGDAAGLVDPLTREGIYFALLSGQWAADSMAAEGGPYTYIERVETAIVPELARAARVQSLFFQPAVARLLIDALLQSAAIRAVMADLIAGRQSYATLKWRLLATCEFGLAFKALRVLDNERDRHG